MTHTERLTLILLRHKMDTLRNLGALVTMNAEEETQVHKDGATIMLVADEAKEILITLTDPNAQLGCVSDIPHGSKQ